uniref:Transposase n=1 Tax=Mycena chlorophos TaxID=658473 RepID=A0ABQ0L7A3_MYCCL|nr:transposase [Mycena chlorophos]
MVFNHISNDAHRIAVRLVKRGKDSREEVAEVCGMSTRTLARFVARDRATGDAAPPPAVNRGRPSILVERDIKMLLARARHNPALVLAEYRVILHKYRHLPASISTIHRALQKAGFTLKTVERVASERDPLAEGRYLSRIAEYSPLQLVCVDEMHKDDRTYARRRARAPRGQRARVAQPFVRKIRYTTIGALALDEGIIAGRVIEGSSDKATFLKFLEEDLLPVMSPYPAPRSVIVLDNARIHHSQEIRDLVASYGCRIEYLPPYSPHLNPIEQAWSVIKAWLEDVGIADSLPSEGYYEMYRALALITPEDTWGFFGHSGYV